jgi:hypothetical protein
MLLATTSAHTDVVENNIKCIVLQKFGGSSYFWKIEKYNKIPYCVWLVQIVLFILFFDFS